MARGCLLAFGIGAGALVIMLLLGQCVNSVLGTSATPAPPTAADVEFSARADAEEKVKSVLKDPDSARFGQEWVRDAKLPIVCGEVNARNSFGGFTGDSEFVVFGTGAAVREPGSDDDGKFVKLWNKLCIDHPTGHSRRKKTAPS